MLSLPSRSLHFFSANISRAKNLWLELQRPVKPQEIDLFQNHAPGRQKVFQGSKLLVRKVLDLILTKDLETKAFSLTYSFILALVPLLAIAFTFFEVFGGLRNLVDETLKPLVQEHFPTETSLQLLGLLDLLISNLQTGTLGAISFVTFLFTVIGLLYNIEKSFNNLFDVRKERSLLRRVLNYWVLITLTPLAVVFSSAKSEQLLNNFEFASRFLTESGFLNISRYLFGFSIQSIAFACLYAVLPSRRVSWKANLIGGTAASVLFELLQYLNVFLSRLAFSDASIQQIYGTVPLLAVIFFIWLRYVWTVVLAGACLAIAYAHIFEANGQKGTLQAPTASLLNCADVFAFICQSFKGQRTELSSDVIADALSLNVAEVQCWLDWLQSRDLIFRVSEGRQEQYFPTHAGLAREGDPAAFLREVLISSHPLKASHDATWASDSQVGEENGDAGAGENQEGLNAPPILATDFAHQIRSLLLAQSKPAP